MAKIITFGELLIDLTQTGSDENGNGKFTAFPGGAPANVAVAASRLGAKTAFIGKLGDDAFGHGLAETLKNEGVDTMGLHYSSEVPTTMAIVSVDGKGERSFSFYRNPGADTQITADEVIRDIDEICDEAGSVLHVGSLSMTTSPAKEATLAAIKHARSKGMLISYDPNYRAALWGSEAFAIEEMKGLLPYADILKVSDEELAMLTGTDDLDKGSRTLAEYGITLVLVTLGGDGVFVRYDEHKEHVPGYEVDVADTNGAGDTFLGAMLGRVTERPGGLHQITPEELTEMVRFANKAASITCTRSGAIPAMPKIEEIKDV